jgi:CRISPR-associated endoribonuclease Cas6
MRFKITLKRIRRSSFLPINYQYELSSLIYKIIHQGDSDFARFLHEQGYMSEGKNFKLFTFSRLEFDHFQTYRDEQRIEHKGHIATFQISFLIDRAAEEFIKGLFMNQQLGLGDKISQIDYEISSIEAVAPPVFRERMHYRCLSPILIKQKRHEEGGENYLHPADEAYKDILLYNLSSKAQAYALAGAASYLPEDIHQTAFAASGKVYKKGIKIKQHTTQATHLIGYMYEFELTAPVELHEIGYYAGFGHLGSQGFGCVGVKNN